MQQEKLKNPFESVTKLWRVEFDTKYKHIAFLEIMFEELALAISSYEISSNSIEAEPEDLWKFICYLPFEIQTQELKDTLKEVLESEIFIFEEVEEDWVSRVQAEAKAVETNKFYVANSKLIENCPQGLIPIKIDAGRAFGTGEHATTKGCLEMLSHIKVAPKKILDVGTGTGVLAIAAKKLWPESIIDATDIDEIAIEIASENSKLNNSNINFNISYNATNKAGEYDLIISNILAKPLIEMAADFSTMLKVGGNIILSGFIEKQFADVCAAYTNFNMSLIKTISDEQWKITLLSDNR